MVANDSTTQFDFTKFLASGAFLRDGEHVVLLSGPFSPAAPAKRQGVLVSCPAFYDSEKASFLAPEAVHTLKTSDFFRHCVSFLEASGEAGSKTPIHWQEPAKNDFEKAFARIQNLIQQGQIDKAVPVVTAKADALATPLRKTMWILELLSAPGVLHAHGWWDGHEGILGATPELLFEVEGRTLKTMALAGTLAKADGSAQDLLRSTKDQGEHRWVVEDICRELKAIGQVSLGPTQVYELPTLWHLHTAITAELHDTPDIQPLINRLHPTAALGVSPRGFGWRWMQELPGQSERARYGAPFTMVLSETRAISLVSIRNVQWSGKGLILGSGCGVVKDSELEAEWNELQRKRQSVLKLLGMMP